MEKHYTKALLCAFLIIFANSAFAQSFAGAGTGASPYEIATSNDLVELATLVNDGTLSTWKVYKLTADIDMTGVATAPIGITGHSFTGKFDGDNHIIKNLTLEGDGGEALGLFGLANGIFSNLGLVNPQINGREGVTTKVQKVGGLIGQYTAGTMENCFVLGGSIKGGQMTGGLVGAIGNNGMTIQDCFSSAEVVGDWYMGGLIGDLKGKTGTFQRLVFYGYVWNFHDPITRLNAEDLTIVTDSYYYIPTPPHEGTNFTGATLLTEEQFADQNSYTNLDFSSTWRMYNSKPVLKSFPLWNGMAGDNEWTTAGNWTFQSAPTASDWIWAPASGSVTISGEANIGGLTIPAGAVIDIKSTGTLTVATSLTNNVGAAGLVLNYTEAARAQLNFSGSTQATIVHTIPASGAIAPGNTAWKPFSTGVVSSATASEAIASDGQNLYFRKSDEVNGTLITSGSTLEGNLGYLVYSVNEQTLTVTGTISGDEQTFSALTVSGADKGFHMLPNNFTTKIDVADIVVPNGNFEQGIWVWNGVDAYTSIDLTATDQLPPGSSFFVKGTVSGDITIPVAAKNTGSAAKKTDAVQEAILIQLKGGSDRAKIRFNANATDAKDNYDLSKLFSIKENKAEVFTTVDNLPVSTNSLPYGFEGRVPVKVLLGENGETTVELSKQNWPSDAETTVWVDGNEIAFDDMFSYTFVGEAGAEKSFEVEISKKAKALDISGAIGSKIEIKSINDAIFVKLAKADEAKLSVYTLQGKLLHEQNLRETENNLDLGLPTGVYAVKVIAADEHASKTVFVK